MEVNIFILRVADLGFPDAATTSEIIGTEDDTDQYGNSAPFTKGRGQQLGLELCPSEIAPEYRLKYKEQPLHDRLFIAMKPIIGSDDEPCIFVLGHNIDGLFLDAIRAKPDDLWHPNKRFVFCVKSGGQHVKPREDT